VDFLATLSEWWKPKLHTATTIVCSKICSIHSHWSISVCSNQVAEFDVWCKHFDLIGETTSPTVSVQQRPVIYA